MSKIVIEAKAMEEWIKVNIKTIIASFSILLVAYFYGYPILSFVFDFLLFCKTSIEQFVKSNSSFAGAFFAFLFMVLFDDIKNLRKRILDNLSAYYIIGEKCILYQTIISKEMDYIKDIVDKQASISEKTISYKPFKTLDILKQDLPLKMSDSDFSSDISLFNIYVVIINDAISDFNNLLDGRYLSVTTLDFSVKERSIEFLEIEKAFVSVRDKLELLQYVNDILWVRVKTKSDIINNSNLFIAFIKLKFNKISKDTIHNEIISMMEKRYIQEGFKSSKSELARMERLLSILKEREGYIKKNRLNINMDFCDIEGHKKELQETRERILDLEEKYNKYL